MLHSGRYPAPRLGFSIFSTLGSNPKSFILQHWRNTLDLLPPGKQMHRERYCDCQHHNLPNSEREGASEFLSAGFEIRMTSVNYRRQLGYPVLGSYYCGGLTSHWDQRSWKQWHLREIVSRWLTFDDPCAWGRYFVLAWRRAWRTRIRQHRLLLAGPPPPPPPVLTKLAPGKQIVSP